MNDGKGSPIIVVPILLLLLCAGVAALAGIALQADEPDQTPVAAPITESDFGTCATPPGPRPTDPSALPSWLTAASECIDDELANLPGYGGAAAEGFQRDVLVVRWNGDVPEIVAKRVTVLTGENGATVVGTRTATTS